MFDYDGNLVELDPYLFYRDSWIMGIAGFLSGIAILIGLLAISIGNLGTTQVLLNSYSFVQILEEVVFLGKHPSFYQLVMISFTLLGAAIIIVFEKHH